MTPMKFHSGFFFFEYLAARDTLSREIAISPKPRDLVPNNPQDFVPNNRLHYVLELVVWNLIKGGGALFEI